MLVIESDDNSKGIPNTVSNGIHLSPLSHVYKKTPNWNEACAMFALPRLPSLVSKLHTHTGVPARGVPLTQMPRRSIHTARAIRSEGPDMMDHLE